MVSGILMILALIVLGVKWLNLGIEFTGGTEMQVKYVSSPDLSEIRSALKKADLSPSDLDIVEINEAFSGVAVWSAQMLDIPHEKVNVNGGAVALGHPLGATGARLIVTLVNALRHRGIILSKLGRHKNTLKIRPPMPFTKDNADLLFDTLDEVLAETPVAA